MTAKFKDDSIESLKPLENEDEIVKYICTNYHVYTPNESNVRILYSSQQNTAKDVFNEITDLIKKSITSNKNSLYYSKKEQLNFGIDSSEILKNLKKRFNNNADFVKNVLEDKSFAKLLQKLDDKLRIVIKDGSVVIGEETEFERFTRTKLIALYYALFIVNLGDINESEIIDLPGLFSDFCDGDGEDRKGINEYLEKCRYQKISEKNIFDMFTVFAVFFEKF